jgi:hypothetical protein
MIVIIIINLVSLLPQLPIPNNVRSLNLFTRTRTADYLHTHQQTQSLFNLYFHSDERRCGER